MPQKGHKKVSDIFRETDYPFSRKGSFKEAFPQIKSAKVKVEETGNLGRGLYSEPSKVTCYNEKNLGEFIDCSNPSCHNGGFSIGKIFQEMEQEKKTHFENLESCQGFEGSQRFQANQRKVFEPF